MNIFFSYLTNVTNRAIISPMAENSKKSESLNTRLSFGNVWEQNSARLSVIHQLSAYPTNQEGGCMVKQVKATEVIERGVIKLQMVDGVINIQADINGVVARPSSTGKTDILATTGKLVTLPGTNIAVQVNIIKWH